MSNLTPTLSDDLQLDPDRCRAARLSRDSRFDGEFFLGVSTTGIYCRPICPARPPSEKNVEYFHHAAQASQAGYRPCLRCRPESAPNSPAWCGSSTTVNRALDLINAGALNESSLEHLATRLGIGERYLRKLFHRELGLSPLAVAQNHRLLFAKKLLLETQLPITTVAFSAGYSSARRFNSAVKTAFGKSPSALRTSGKQTEPNKLLSLQLNYRPPYDWPGVIDFFQRHAVDGVEQVSATHYQRNIRINGVCGFLRVSQMEERNALELQLSLPEPTALMPIVATVRRMFDLDANPRMIAEGLAKDRVLKPLIAECPGIRVPGHPGVFEATVRAIAGQQVSIAAARQVCSKLANATKSDPGGEKGPLYFPQPAALAALSDEAFPMPVRRRETLKAVSQYFLSGEAHAELTDLAQIKGIGPWTTAMVAMRGHGNPDIFPMGDLGLVKAYTALSSQPSISDQQLAAWQPWRSYAANLLWRSLST